MVVASAKRPSPYLNYRQSAWWFFLGWLFGVLMAAFLFAGDRDTGAAVRSSLVEAPDIPSDGTSSTGSGTSTGSNPRMVGNGWQGVDVFVGSDASIFHAAARLANRPHLGAIDQKPWQAQAFQDQVVAALFRNQRHGYFLDLAANDAVFISNTYSLERHLEWSGLCVEANPIYWMDLARLRNCTVVGAAVGGVTRAVEPIQFNLAGYDSGLVGAGFDQKTVKDDSKLTVYTVPIAEILERHTVPKIIDYMSLDVEGAEFYVMENFPFDTYTIKVLTGERLQQSLKSLLESKGYKFVKNLAVFDDALWIHSSFESQLDMASLEKIPFYTGQHPTG